MGTATELKSRATTARMPVMGTNTAMVAAVRTVTVMVTVMHMGMDMGRMLKWAPRGGVGEMTMGRTRRPK